MNRFKLMVAIVLMAMLALGGCSSEEDKKQSHLTKGKEYFDKGEFKSAKIWGKEFGESSCVIAKTV